MKNIQTYKKVEASKVSPLLSKSFEASGSNKVLHQETFTIPSYQVKKSEILLAVHSILTYATQRTMEKCVKLTKVLFLDSKIPQQLELGRTKLGYLLQFGLAPHYKEQLFSSLLLATGFAPKLCILLRRGIYNYISKRKQMDVHVLYFHEEKQQVIRSYIGSHFLGHAITEEIFQLIQAVHGKVGLTHNLVQVSMGGPNVNWKTVEIVKEYREHNDPDGPDLIEIGSCGLHVLHGA